MSSVAHEQATVPGTALAELERHFRGVVVTPDDAAYDAARRIWNASVDRRPALVARCRDAHDVSAAVRLARQTGLPVAVRSGGHSLPGHSVCDGGVVIDLGLMKGIRIDPERGTVRAEAGVILGELDRETQRLGLAVPAGIVTHTGLAGLTLGGGIGHLMRKHGLTIDNLLSVDLVTAAGDLVTADESNHPDLFWGVRGGGGNFGVVTSLEYRLSAVGPVVLAGPIAWPMEDSPELLRFYREWITDVPDELTTIVTHRRAPALPTWPEELHGRHVVIVTCCYAGDVERGEQVLRPLREFGTPLLDGCVPKPFVAHQAMFDPTLPWGWHYYARAFDVATLTDEVIDISVEHSLRIVSPRTSWPIFQLGGAVARVGANETPYHGRSSGHTFNVVAVAPTDDGEGFDREHEWALGLYSALEPHQTSVYVNFLLDEGGDRIRQAYGAAKYERLQAVKRAYDPDNFFRLNQNIRPD